MNNRINNIHVKILIIILASMLSAYISSTRSFFLTNSDDLYRYYEGYLLAAKVGLTEYLLVENKEPLFQLYNFVVYHIFGIISPSEYLIFISILSSSLLSCFLFKINANTSWSWLVFFALFLPPVLIYNTQLIRQGISLYILLIAMLCKSNTKFTFVLISMGFHFTSFFVFLFYHIMRVLVVESKLVTRTFSIIALFFFGILFPYIFNYLVVFIGSIDLIGIKVGFLSNLSLSIDINYIGFFSLLVNVFYLIICSPRDDSKQLYTIVLTIVSISVLTLYFAPLSQRFFFLNYVVLIPSLISVMKRFLKKDYYFLITLTVMLVYTLITIRYLTVPSDFSLFNGYFT